MRRKKFSTFILFFCISCLLAAELRAQSWSADTIHVNINSGNPSFPFPQFTEYANGKSLAKYNGEGVTHADMEKAMREAYEIMMHRTLYTGQSIGTGATQVRYMVYNHMNVPNYGPESLVSEGDGYALLAAAYMGDKKTFDGLWCRLHDNRLSVAKRYIDCGVTRPTYLYGSYIAGWHHTADATNTSNGGDINVNAAPDGDFDIALALLIAYKQWGPLMGVNDNCGTPISYKTEATKYIKALADTVFFNNGDGNPNPRHDPTNANGYYSGDIGFDGYIKSANTNREWTTWTNGTGYTFGGFTFYPRGNNGGTGDRFTDYLAPSYFRQFAAFLQSVQVGTELAFHIDQFKRAEASSDWLIGQMYAKGYIPSSGQCSVSNDGSVTTFTQLNGGEDFRASWRTLLNYVWHGNGTTKWNPVTHQVIAGANTYEYDMAIRHANFLKYPRQNPTPGNINTAVCSTLGTSPDLSCPLWKGVVQIKQTHNVDGSVLSDFRTNRAVGTGTMAAVASGDVDLTAELYRQCELLWDDAIVEASGLTDDQRYIRNTPIYFHDWFRLLGMLTASGNLHPPTTVAPAANMKVYMAVDKTFAYEGDLVTYTVSYRNYGSVTATGVSISTVLDSDYQFVSASNGGTLSGSTITWNNPTPSAGNTVPGFQSATGIPPTQGFVTFVVKVKPAPVHPRVCLTSTITATNAPTWVSNEFPNNATYTMERNCVDLLIDRVLAIKKTADRTVMNSGDIVNFTLNFENKTGSNLWLNGGRDRVVLSYANYHATNGTSFYQFYRIWHTGHEAYIKLSNYRISYFMNDAAAIGKYDAATNPTGWDTYVDNQSDLNKYGYNPLTLPVNQQLNFTYQKIPWGSDANGSWNQRVVTQFANVLSATSTHIYDKLDHMDYIHKGVVGPGFTRTRFESKPSSDLTPRIADDWSYSAAVANTSLDGQAQRFFPVSPTYTVSATNFAPVTINNYSKDICNPDVPNFQRVLVEEFDGYTWRRIAGLGPLPGRETYNVVVTDSIPIELSWSAFTDAVAVGVTATYTALAGNPKFSGYVKWTIPVMLVGESGDLSYKTIAKSPCAEKTFINAGWIWSDVDSPDSSRVNLRLTCTTVPPTPPAETSLKKTADKTSVSVGDVITYTLTFKNTDGSTAAWAGTSTVASDWQALGTGIIPKLNGTAISLDQNGAGNPSPGSVGYAFGHKKSHGKNGWMEATIDVSNSSMVGFIYRYQPASAAPGQAGFQGVRLDVTPNPSGANTINFTVYNNAAVLATITGLAYPGSSDPINIRTQLVDDKLYIWVNDYTGAPLKVISGITQVTAGFTGIYGGNSSQQSITAYKAHFDSAFDLVMTDPVPAQLNTITAYGATGHLTGSTLTWDPVTGPIAAGATIMQTFKATVASCSNFITNIATASTYGVSNIQSQYVVSCAGALPVDFISFTGHAIPQGALISWTVVNERDNTGFYIERSGDGKTFQPIGFVAGSNNAGIHTYSFTDIDFTDLSYYRIKQVDVDGTEKRTNIIAVSSGTNNTVYIYPNPSQQGFTIRMQQREGVSCHVYSASGQLVESMMLGTSLTTIGNDWAKGVYMLQIVSDDQVTFRKLIKE